MGKIEDKDIDLHIDCETLLQEYIPKAQYEQRLKADMVAMLTEIQLEIEEIQSSQDCCDYAIDNCISRCDVADLIQQKINALKGE